jgi:SAM-dependent methyltransferase
MRPIHIKSATDVKYDDEALDRLSGENDSKYWNDEYGIIAVDEARWRAAQQFEKDGWFFHWSDMTDDRSMDHDELFDRYRALTDDLGNTVEIGCGPFTQIRHIVRKRGKRPKSLTLVDPMVYQYMALSNCSYKNWNIDNVPVAIAEFKAEEFPTHAKHAVDVVHNIDKYAYDTVICINVLEHVQDVKQVLSNILLLMRDGAILVLGERTYDDLDINKLYDVGHPIRIKSRVIDEFMQHFNILYRCSKPGYDGYVIAKLKR